MALGMIALCEALGWWRIPFASTPTLMALLGVGLAISCAPIYFVTWRLARRFGWRGLAVFVGHAMMRLVAGAAGADPLARTTPNFG
jgi:hypothetical protein